MNASCRPPESADAPDAELQALSSALGRPVEPGLAASLLQYLDLLARWNSTYNLTAIRTREGMLTQHLLDCLSIVAPLRMMVAAKQPTTTGLRCLDVGSGGGLPGIVIAACLPDVEVVCIDTVGKKAAFIRQAAAELDLPNLHGEHARVEAFRSSPFHVVASRAFASLSDFTRLTHHLLAPGGVWMAMKGKLPNEELDKLPASIDVFHVEQLTVPGLDAQRCLVWMQPKNTA